MELENAECMQTVKRGLFVLLLGLLERLLAAIVKKLSSWLERLREKAKSKAKKHEDKGTA